MKPPPFIPPPQACEACQQALSEIADTGGTLPPETQAHLDGCEACTQFAELWLQTPPAVLARQAFPMGDPRLRERILRATTPANVVPFPGPARGISFFSSLSRVAACLALAGLAYWLLDPTRSPVHAPEPERLAGPTMSQRLLRMEGQTQHERQALQTALVDGGRQVHHDVAWSMSALEL